MQRSKNFKVLLIKHQTKKCITFSTAKGDSLSCSRLRYSNGSAIQQGDWITADISTDESRHMRIANNPQKLLKRAFPSRLNDRGDVEV